MIKFNLIINNKVAIDIFYKIIERGNLISREIDLFHPPFESLELDDDNQNTYDRLRHIFLGKIDIQVLNSWSLGYGHERNPILIIEPLIKKFFRFREESYFNILSRKKIKNEQIFSKYNPCFLFGRDKFGHIILYQLLSKFEFNLVEKNKEIIFKIFIKLLSICSQKTIQWSKHRGLVQYKTFVILDLKNIKFTSVMWYKNTISL